MATPVPKINEIMGWVVSIHSGPRDNPVLFMLRVRTDTNEEKNYRCECPFFCPVQEGDCVFGYVQEKGPLHLVYVYQPFVQIPVNEEQVKVCFVRALHGSGFGRVSADNLYTRLGELAKFAHFAKQRMEERKRAATPEVKEKIMAEALVSGPDGVIAYLSDMASRYDRTGDPTIIDSLMKGTQLRSEQVQKLLMWWHKHRSLRRLHLLGLTNGEIKGCHRPLDEIYTICMVNPFKLPAIPLDKAEKIMISMRKTPTPHEKLCGQIVRKIYEMAEQQGWTGCPLWLLAKQFNTFHSLRDTLIADYEVTLEHNLAYLPYPYHVETYVSEYIDKRVKSTAKTFGSVMNSPANEDKVAIPPPLPTVDLPELETAMYSCKTLTQEQKIAIQGALQHDVSMIIGGAGTGKSTLIKEIVNNLETRDIPYMAVAFTGKAVARIQEVLKRKLAMTMDRCIARAATLPPFHHLIIDEVGMVTSELFYRFIRAFPGQYKITFVGDVNQLQPIGWGCLMKQMLIARRIPTYKLDVNHRIIQHDIAIQATPTLPDGKAPGQVNFDRVILDNANALVNPKRDLDNPLTFKSGVGFYQMEGDQHTIHAIIKSLHDAGITKDRITVLCPYNEPLAALNNVFQTIFLSEEKRMADPNRKLWYVGDRVMSIVNNYDINFMNGETGTVTDLTDKGVEVELSDGSKHTFSFTVKKPWQKKGEALQETVMEDEELNISQLTHAFACSVHKYQGSQCEFVIFYIPLKEKSTGGVTISSFLNINLLYTGITRTQRACWLVGSEMAISQATCKKSPNRYESLGLRLIQCKDAKLEESLASINGEDTKPKDEPPPEDDDLPNMDDFADYE